MSNKRFAENSAARRYGFGQPAGLVLTALSGLLALAAFAGLFFVLSLGSTSVAAAPAEEPGPVAGSFTLAEHPQALPGSLVPAVIAAPMAPTNTTTTIGCAVGTCPIPDAPDPSVVGQAYSVNFYVQPSPANGHSVDGTLTVTDGTGASCSVTYDSAIEGPAPYGWQTACSLASTSAGNKTLTATFVPLDPAVFNGSSDTEPHQVIKTDTTTTITQDTPDPSAVGEPVPVHFTVTPVQSGGPALTGNVTVSDGTDSCTGTVAAGQCTLTLTTLGARTLTATFTPDNTAAFNGSSDTEPHQVNKADTQTVLTFSPASPNSCQPVTLTATVSRTSPGSGTPTGSVTFNDGMTVLGTATLSGGVATLSLNLSAGTHSITASYGGDTNYNGSTSSPPQTFTVTKAKPTVILTASPGSPQTFGTQVTLTAEVQGVGSCGTPTGHVYFNDNGVVIGTAALDNSGHGTLVVPLFSSGSHLLKAVYESDNESYLDSESASQTYGINRRDTTTTLVSSANPSVWGQTVTFTATVSSAISFTPSGQVLFRDGGTVIAEATLDGSGRAVFSTADLEVSPPAHSITADYLGDQNFLPSTGSLSQTVNKADTTTTVTCQPNPSVYGQSVTCTATVTPVAPGAGVPTGEVWFYVGTDLQVKASLGFGNPGEATWITSVADQTELKPAGSSPTVKATYQGDNHFTCTACSGTHVQTVNPADTQVRAQAPLATVDFGQQVQITGIVSVVQPGAGSVSGKLVFTVNATPTYTATLDGTTPSATFSTNTLPIGTNAVCGQYLHDTNPNFNDSPAPTGTPECVDVTVNKAKSKTSLITAPNPSFFGQTAVFTATVTPAGASTSTITPTGTVTFTFPGVGTMTGTLDSLGVATVTTDTLPVGVYDVTADYGGDGDFLPSSASWQHTVSRNGTTTTLTLSPPGSAAVGTPVTFTATVSSTGGITPTGSVTFWAGVTVVGSGPLNASGVATFSTSSLSAGSHSLKATYDGTPAFSPSSSDRQNYTISAAGSTTAVTTAPNPSTFGQTVTITATVSVASGTPTGQVTFQADSTTLGTATLNASGVATFSTAGLAAGTYTIKATYSGDSNYGGSTGTTGHTVNKADTTTALTKTPVGTTVYGQLLTLNASVTGPGAGTPTGTVTFKDGTTPICSSVPLSGGSASCTTTNLSVAGSPHSLTAEYSGDSNLNPSTSTAVPHTVNKANTTTTVSSTPNPSLVSTPVTINATVAAVAPGAGTPTGTVDFKDGAANITGCTGVSLSGGSASCTTSALTVGAHTLNVDYGGDSNFNSSSGSTSHTVGDTPTDLSVTKTDSPDPVNAGSDLTYIVTVSNIGLTTAVTLTDKLPSAVTLVPSPTPSQGSCSGTTTITCNLGNVSSGGNATVTIVVHVPVTTPAGTILRNTATVTGDRPDSNPSNNSATQETTVFRSPTMLGDCNGDQTVDRSDIFSIVSDIFDPTFPSSLGCDANVDTRVDAGDVPCTALLMGSGVCGTGAGRNSTPQAGFSAIPSAGLAGPALAVSGQVSPVPGTRVAVPISFAANDHPISSLAFSIDYDESWLSFDPADSNGDGIPDAVTFNVSGDFDVEVRFDPSDANGELDLFVGDATAPLTSLPDGIIAFITVDVESAPSTAEEALRFSLDPGASFGNTLGLSVPGTATPAGRHRILLPLVLR